MTDQSPMEDELPPFQMRDDEVTHTFRPPQVVRWGPQRDQWGWVADPAGEFRGSKYNLRPSPAYVWVWPCPNLERIRRDNVDNPGSPRKESSFEIGAWHHQDELFPDKAPDTEWDFWSWIDSTDPGSTVTSTTGD